MVDAAILSILHLAKTRHKFKVERVGNHYKTYYDIRNSIDY